MGFRAFILKGCPALTGAAILASCGGSGSHGPNSVLPTDFTEWTPDRDAYLPTQLRIHPLTRVTRETDRTEVLVCHIELRDQLKQITKCLGVVQVELLPADPQGNPRSDVDPERLWQVDLRDPGANAAAFDDVITRTYELRLGTLPPALARVADAPETDDSDHPSYAVRVRFLFKDSNEAPRELEASAPLAS